MRQGYHGWTKTAVKWPNRLRCRLDVYPVGGLAFALLIVFMMWTPTPHHSRSVNLPQSEYAIPMPGAAREDAQIVTVMRDGRVYYRNLRIGIDELQEQIRASVRSGAERKVYIRADPRTKYMDIKLVLNEISKADIQNVSFLAERASP